MKRIDALTEEFKIKYERFLIGCDSLEELGLWNKDENGEMDIFYKTDLVSVILRLIAADGEICEKEVEYMNKNFGFSYTARELAYVYENCREEICNSFDEQFESGVSLLCSVNAALADLYKELLSLICDIIIESDGVIAQAEAEEAALLKNIIGI